jgi:hypothetical protein
LLPHEATGIRQMLDLRNTGPLRFMKR